MLRSRRRYRSACRGRSPSGWFPSLEPSQTLHAHLLRRWKSPGRGSRPRQPAQAPRRRRTKRLGIDQASNKRRRSAVFRPRRAGFDDEPGDVGSRDAARASPLRKPSHNCRRNTLRPRMRTARPGVAKARPPLADVVLQILADQRAALRSELQGPSAVKLEAAGAEGRRAPAPPWGGHVYGSLCAARPGS